MALTVVHVPHSLDGGGARVGGETQKAIQSPMAQGRSTKIISTMRWIQPSRLSTDNFHSKPRATPRAALLSPESSP